VTPSIAYPYEDYRYVLSSAFEVEKEGSVLREFYVTCRVEKWFVDEGTESHGPYLSQHDAIADAIEAAEQLAKSKKAINVLLKIRGSSAELIWSSKRSSFST